MTSLRDSKSRPHSPNHTTSIIYNNPLSLDSLQAIFLSFSSSTPSSSHTGKAKKRGNIINESKTAKQQKKGRSLENYLHEMGLCSDLNDVSSDSIPLLLVALLANCVSYLRSLLFCIFQSVGLYRYDGAGSEDSLISTVGSGLAGFIVLTEQLNVNRAFCYRQEEDGVDSDCVVCFCKLSDGDRVRRLACRHVFHRDCLDGWLFDHHNFNCPLCRTSLVSDERIADVDRRLGDDLASFFSPASC